MKFKGFVLLLNLALISQAYSFCCNYSNGTEVSNYDRFNTTGSTNILSIQQKIDLIVATVGLPANFITIEIPNSNNARAFNDNHGLRYIGIDPKWFSNNQLSEWEIISVLAHEIGHHLSGHTNLTFAVSNSVRQNQELEADKFSGFIIQKLGGSIFQAKSALNKLIVSTSLPATTHPHKESRLLAIEQGFGGVQSSLPSQTTYTAEYYYSMAHDLLYAYSIDGVLGVQSIDQMPYSQKELARNYLIKAYELNNYFVSQRYLIGMILLSDALANYNQYSHNIIQAYVQGLQNMVNNWGLTYEEKSQAYFMMGYSNSTAAHKMESTYGFQAYAKSYYQKAIEYYNTATRFNSKNYSIYLNRGIASSNLVKYYGVQYAQYACADFKYSCQMGIPLGCQLYQQIRCSN